MFKNYFKTALRNFWRHKAYSSINVLGLSVGLACSFFILLWVQDEFSYDGFHEDGDRIYRVMRNAHFSDDQIFTWNAITYPLAQALEDDYAEITDAVLFTWEEEMLFAAGDRSFREHGRHVGPAMFDVFSFPVLAGDPRTMMGSPTSVVLSESLARKYFGDDWRTTAVGQTLHVDNRADFTVTGVFADIPHNSSLRFDFVIPIEEFYSRNDWLDHWGNNGLNLYVRLAEGSDGALVSTKIRDVIRDHHESSNSDLFLQPFTDIRLHSDFKEGKLVGGRIEYVRIFSLVAVFILLIASINFMNLATARSSQRAREIGVRKAVGASQQSLVGQFIGESVLTALFAWGVAVVFVVLLLPAFNALTSKEIALGTVGPVAWLAFVGIAVLTGLLAGSYPAVYLSSFNVIKVMRASLQQNPGGGSLRKTLVVFQFGLSILLIIGTMTVYQQLSFIRNKNLGLDRENLLYMNLEGGAQARYDAFRQELLQKPGIAGVTTSSQNALTVGQSTSDPSWEGKAPDSNILFHIISANFDYIETMKMEMVSGRSFSKDFGTDSTAYIINEQTALAMGFEDPVGQRLSFWGGSGEVIGVVKDFHFSTLYAPIEPLIIRLSPDDTWVLLVRTRPGMTTEALASLEGVHKAFNPEYPFEYKFLDEEFEEMYRNEATIGNLANTFAFLAVFIACLGLFGLASFTAERRTKEIGIRKVLGASVANLVVLLSREFIVLVLVAFVLAAPVAYYAMDQWLSEFAYRIDMGVWIFALAGVTAVVIAWLTVSYQSFRAAVANPVKALRTE